MDRRSFLRLVVFGGAGAGGLIGWRSFEHPGPPPGGVPEDWDRRVRFVCCVDAGDYSPAVYLRLGGGRRAFETVLAAAPFLRPDDAGASAAGLCGYLFRHLGYDGETGGTMALDPPPVPGPDGEVDWKAFGADADVILINVQSRTARCCFGSVEGREVRDLPIGKRKGDRR